MPTPTQQHHGAEILYVIGAEPAATPAKAFFIQVRTDDTHPHPIRETRWLRISPDQLKEISFILVGK